MRQVENCVGIDETEKTGMPTTAQKSEKRQWGRRIDRSEVLVNCCLVYIVSVCLPFQPLLQSVNRFVLYTIYFHPGTVSFFFCDAFAAAEMRGSVCVCLYETS